MEQVGSRLHRGVPTSVAIKDANMQDQLDRIEVKLDQLLANKKPGRNPKELDLSGVDIDAVSERCPKLLFSYLADELNVPKAALKRAMQAKGLIEKNIIDITPRGRSYCTVNVKKLDDGKERPYVMWNVRGLLTKLSSIS